MDSIPEQIRSRSRSTLMQVEDFEERCNYNMAHSIHDALRELGHRAEVNTRTCDGLFHVDLLLTNLTARAGAGWPR